MGFGSCGFFPLQVDEMATRRVRERLRGVSGESSRDWLVEGREDLPLGLGC